MLKEIKEEFEKRKEIKNEKIWIYLARWLNFEKYFAFEKEPNTDKIQSDDIQDLQSQFKQELSQYEKGILS